MIRAIRRSVACGLLLFVPAPAALAVKPAVWKHRNPQDFAEGVFDHVVTTSDGELLLGRTVKVLHETKDDAYAVNALARGPDGALYAATSGRTGLVLRVAGAEPKVFATLPDSNVLSLVFSADGFLLAGTGGEHGRIYQVDASGRFRLFHEPSGAKYVWAMVRGRDGEIFAATGVDGKLFRISADGKQGKVLFDAKQKNLLCLAPDANGMLYTGSDEDGLVFRVDPKDGKAYALYDAAEPEVSAVTVDSQGNVFAATASADRAKPGGEPAPPKPAGKPETPPPSRPAQPQTDTAPAAMFNALLAKGMPGKSPSGPGSIGGNAIYRIDRDGFVTEVFREKVMILSLLEAGGRLYAGTGNEGRVYEVCPTEEKSSAIAKLAGAQAVCLLRLEDNTLVVGTANAGAIVRIEAGYARKGTFVSKPLDARQVVRFGRAKWRATVPEGTRLTIATRSGNVEDGDSPVWDAWSAEADAAAGVQIASPAARFLQYRLTFEAARETATPVLSEIMLTRLEDNRPPTVEAVSVGSIRKLSEDPALTALKGKLMPLMGRPGASMDQFAILWKAEDPNGDEMLFDIFYRLAGSTPWVKYKEDLKDTVEAWDIKTVSDGVYEVKVVARDTPDNPPGTALSFARVSDPVILDSTPPVITIERMERDGDKLHVRATLKDGLSAIADAKYTVNSHDKWVALAAADDIFDSADEMLEFTIDSLPRGECRVVIRVADECGNTAYATRIVEAGS